MKFPVPTEAWEAWKQFLEQGGTGSLEVHAKRGEPVKAFIRQAYGAEEGDRTSVGANGRSRVGAT